MKTQLVRVIDFSCLYDIVLIDHVNKNLENLFRLNEGTLSCFISVLMQVQCIRMV